MQQFESFLAAENRVATNGKITLFWVVLVAGIVGVAELLVRVALDPPGLYHEGRENPALTAHPSRGYALMPGASDQYTAGGVSVTIDINRRGFRDGPYSEAVKSDLRLLALGDSFTLGLGVDATDTWPEQLERFLQGTSRARASVVNAGVEGYSARQMRQVAEEVMPELRPHVILFGANVETYWRVDDPYVFLGGQLVRESVLPLVTVGRRGLYYSPIRRWPWLHGLDIWLNRHLEVGAHVLALGHRASAQVRGWVAGRPDSPAPAVPEAAQQGGRPSPTEEIAGQLGPMLSEIARMDDTARTHGIVLVVLLINPQERDGSFRPAHFAFNRIVEEFCRARRIHVVNPLPALVAVARGRPVYRTRLDYHWSPEAHRVAAEVLYEYLAREGLVRPRRQTAPGSPVAEM
jgi:lysophospholipase L1-like esterase